jgi:hypothetical protein
MAEELRLPLQGQKPPLHPMVVPPQLLQVPSCLLPEPPIRWNTMHLSTEEEVIRPSWGPNVARSTSSICRTYSVTHFVADTSSAALSAGPWRGHGRAMAGPWPGHGAGHGWAMAGPWPGPWPGHAPAMGPGHGQAIAQPWSDHGPAMARPWPGHGPTMARAWPNYGPAKARGGFLLLVTLGLRLGLIA